MKASSHAAALRPEIEELQTSKIAEVFYAGANVRNLLPLWFGEGDTPTPDFVKRACLEALAADKTKYVDDRGILPLRESIARYLTTLHGKPIATERVQVCASGMSSVMLTMQAIAGPGDNVVYTAPVWPNIVEAVRIVKAEPRPARLVESEGGWTLDIARLESLCDARTRAIFVSSPGNPTGWTIDEAGMRALLEICRRRRIWLVVDEVYNRLTYDTPRAASPLDLATPDDPVFSINSFSKSWCMTGWRIGWIIGPAWTVDHLRKLSQYNTTGPATFIQWAGITAIEQGEPFIAEQRARLRRARDLVIQGLQRFPRVRVGTPAGAFYAFFKLECLADSTAFAKRLVLETGVGLSPGAAFGGEGEGFMRLCFASSEARLSEALERMAPLLK
jgi:aspartate/methionine/tyrosine aminotransferase